MAKQGSGYNLNALSSYLQTMRGAEGFTPSFTDRATDAARGLEEDPFKFYLDDPIAPTVPYSVEVPTVDLNPEGNPVDRYNQFHNWVNDLGEQLVLDEQQAKQVYMTDNYKGLDKITENIQRMALYDAGNPQLNDLIAKQRNIALIADKGWEAERNELFAPRRAHLANAQSKLEGDYKPEADLYRRLDIAQGYAEETVTTSPVAQMLVRMDPTIDSEDAARKAMLRTDDPTMGAKVILAKQFEQGLTAMDAYQTPDVPTGMSTNDYYDNVGRVAMSLITDPDELATAQSLIPAMEQARKKSIADVTAVVMNPKSMDPAIANLRAKKDPTLLQREILRRAGQQFSLEMADIKARQIKTAMKSLYQPKLLIGMHPNDADVLNKVFYGYRQAVNDDPGLSATEAMKISQDRVQEEMKLGNSPHIDGVLARFQPILLDEINSNYSTLGLRYTQEDLAMLGHANRIKRAMQGDTFMYRMGLN